MIKEDEDLSSVIGAGLGINLHNNHRAIRGLIKCPECGIYNNCTCGHCKAHGCEKDLVK